MCTHILVLTQVGSAVRAHVLDDRGVYALGQLQNGIPKEQARLVCIRLHNCIPPRPIAARLQPPNSPLRKKPFLAKALLHHSGALGLVPLDGTVPARLSRVLRVHAHGLVKKQDLGRRHELSLANPPFIDYRSRLVLSQRSSQNNDAATAGVVVAVAAGAVLGSASSAAIVAFGSSRCGHAPGARLGVAPSSSGMFCIARLTFLYTNDLFKSQCLVVFAICVNIARNSHKSADNFCNCSQTAD